MNINYHYYTIKTLAHYAGFKDEEAQQIAYFSQQIDDFIMCSPFIVEKEPPDFFLKHNLALKLNEKQWIFSPCPTGINMISTVSHNYQLHTLMPFHFIMPTTYSELPKNVDRSLYRCVTANQKEPLLLNRLVEKLMINKNRNDKTFLMQLGMLLHTFADTYAHSGFSGFHGWENESYVNKMEHKIAEKESKYFIVRFFKGVKEKLFGKKEPYDAMCPAEIKFYSKLPSIGHGNVAHAPDYCECKISLYGKKTKDGILEPVIERDNTDYFAECSRHIFEILCRVNDKPVFNDTEWNDLHKKLSEAQNVRDQNNQKKNKKKWLEVFPNINYHYRKDEFMGVKLTLLQENKQMKKILNINKRELSNAYSEEGDQARIAFLMMGSNVNDVFYEYNEFAYRHVFHVVGEYASEGDFAQLKDYHGTVLKAEI